MIERMKKITLLVSEKDRHELIHRLREAGVLHVRHVVPPLHHEINFIDDRIAKIEEMLSILAPYAVKGGEDGTASAHERDILCRAEDVTEHNREKQGLLEAKRDIEKKMLWFAPWGEFDPRDLKFLADRGIVIRLYRIRQKDFRQVPDNIDHFIVGSGKGHVYVATVSPDPGQKLPFEDIKTPQDGPERMRQQLEDIDVRLSRVDEFLADAARAIGAMKRCEKKLRKERESLAVRFGMKEEGQFSYVQGFCPVKDVKKICALARHHGVGYLVEDPDDPDETPTHITNPKWIRIIDPVFTFMNTLPGYNEFDISFYFLIFFSLFFAMLIGDAGYGLLFLVVTFLARRAFRNLPAEPFFLMYLLSASTIVWGVITGTYFGVEKIAELPVLKSLVVPRISSFAPDSQNTIIFICFVIGAAQLTVAHLLRALRIMNSLRALAEVGWIMILWGMFFAAGKFVIARPFPQEAGWSLAVGVTLVLFCTNPQKGIFRGALITLANLPLSVISSFSDIVSYLRLFAVGYATVVVAGSFNGMAASSAHGVLGSLAAALILFMGHALNITLGFMAVIVHGIRLNMLEFSNHLGMQWSGKKYEPFCE